jgi:segregation and condensation protein B
MTAGEQTNDRSVDRSVEIPEAHLTLAFEELKLSVEAILFAADRPLEVTEIRDFVGSVSLTDIRLALKDLGHDFEGRSIEIIEVGRKYQLRTRSNFAPTVTKLFSGKPRTLSRSALETLAIVAYRQPVTRAEVNALRQVDSSQVMTSLRERELIYPSGTRKDVGHPVEYRTTPKFLDIFGLADLKELPKLRSLQMNIDDETLVKKALGTLESPPEPEEIAAESLAFADPEALLERDADSESEMEFDARAEEEAEVIDQAEVVAESEAPAEARVGAESEVPTARAESTESTAAAERQPKAKTPRPVRIDDSEGLARPVFSRRGATAARQENEEILEEEQEPEELNHAEN